MGTTFYYRSSCGEKSARFGTVIGVTRNKLALRVKMDHGMTIRVKPDDLCQR